jgi:hypothetical protein
MVSSARAPIFETPVGEVRPSQLLWTYGPGALIDLPNVSVVTLGIEKWDKNQCMPVQEVRLLAAVRKVLGPQVEGLRMPPLQKGDISRWSSELNIGVPVKPFPRWMRCVRCGLLSSYDDGLFELKVDRNRSERTRFVHKDCRGSQNNQPPRDADAVPARFLLACRAGHLDDFPWHYYVHGGKSDCRGKLRFFEDGASMQTENLWVKCDGCPKARNLAQAFGKIGQANLPACRGRHPHLDTFDANCEEEARAVLLGATNSWFPITLSALAIPPKGDNPLSQLIADGWNFFEDSESESQVLFVVKTLSKTGDLAGIDQYDYKEIWAAIQAHKASGGDDESVGESDIKSPEWDVLVQANPPTDYPHFMSKKVQTPIGFEPYITRVLLLERLREVNALLGFTRVEAPEEAGEGKDKPKMASLSYRKPEWVPASQVHGEGIFIQFSEDAITKWEKLTAVFKVEQRLRGGNRGWRNSRHLNPDEGYPGTRYAMLHTLAHLLIRELALECGYNAASIRERIYADTSYGPHQAGILIYTAAADSDGTLGGLVDLGKPENLGRLLEQALARSKICSSDPLCSEHDADKDRSLHGAACHACSFVAETSCERGNRFLDRSLLIPTLESDAAAFFKDLDADKVKSAKTDGIYLNEQINAESTQSNQSKEYRLRELVENFPNTPFVLQVPFEDKIKRLNVKPISTLELIKDQNIVLSVSGMKQRGKQVSTAIGKFKLAEQLDAATDQMQYLITVTGDGGIAQIKMPKKEWDRLTSVGLIE